MGRRVNSSEREDRVPTFAACLRAARAVRRAEYGEDALAEARPRGVLGLVRSRGPLAVQLYVAAREGRLVWIGEEEFAVLRPPARTSIAFRANSPALFVLRNLDNHWERILLAVPSVFVILCVCLSIWATPGWALLVAYFAWLQLLLIVGALTVTSGKWVHDSLWSSTIPHKDAISLARSWRLQLCHRTFADNQGQFIGRAFDQWRILATDQANCLVYSRRANTTKALRDAWDRASPSHFLPGDVAQVFVEPAASSNQNREPTLSKRGFLALYLVGAVIVLAVTTQFLSGQEGVSYAAALKYLIWRLAFVGASGSEVRSASGLMLGWLTSLLSVTSICVVIVSGVSLIRSRRGNSVTDKGSEPVPSDTQPSGRQSRVESVVIELAGSAGGRLGESSLAPASSGSTVSGRLWPRIAPTWWRKAVGLGLVVGVLWWASSGEDFWRGFVAGLLVNELTDVSPWLASVILDYAASRWVPEGDDRRHRRKSWKSAVERCPGKMLKLVAALILITPVGLAALAPSLRRPGKMLLVQIRQIPKGIHALGYLVGAVSLVTGAMLLSVRYFDALNSFLNRIAVDNARNFGQGSDTLFFAVGALAVVVIVVGGLRYVASGDREDQVVDARNVIAYTASTISAAFIVYAAITLALGSVA